MARSFLLRLLGTLELATPNCSFKGRVHDLGRRTKDDSSQRTALSCKRLFPREAGLATTDALQCIASHRRWHHFCRCFSAHHFPGRFSGHHFLRSSLTSRLSRPCVPACSSPALRPGPFLPSLASNVLFQHHSLRQQTGFSISRLSLAQQTLHNTLSRVVLS